MFIYSCAVYRTLMPYINWSFLYYSQEISFLSSSCEQNSDDYFPQEIIETIRYSYVLKQTLTIKPKKTATWIRVWDVKIQHIKSLEKGNTFLIWGYARLSYIKIKS